MKVLMAAYACEPGRGSEPGVGWTFANAAAETHDVWLITRTENRNAIEGALAADQTRLHPVYVDFPARAIAWQRELRGMRFHYVLWQLLVLREGRRLRRTIPFDVAHHVTFAVDWLPSALAFLPGLPLVWGPVGGATGTPPTMFRWLDRRDVVFETARGAVTAAFRRLSADPVARRAAVVVAQNQDVARRFRRARRVVVEPNVAIDVSGIPPARVAAGPGRRAVFCGRLIGWKGIRLAVATIADPAAAGWTLDVYGDGPAQAGAEALADELGVGDRIRFHGAVPRRAALDAVATADAFLFPSIHDAAGWAVAEAICLGTPVVCLDRGGPAVLVGGGGGVAVPAGPRLSHRLATALAGVNGRYPRSDRWGADRLPQVLATWYGWATMDQVGAGGDLG